MQKTQECLLERKEAVGRGTWYSTLPYEVHRCVLWQQGREDLFPGSGKGLQQAKSSTTDWVGGLGVGSAMSLFQRSLVREGPAQLALSRTLMCQEGRRPGKAPELV